MAFDYTKQSDNFWKKHLPKETFRVCRLKGTEQAGSGKYDKFYEKGIYYCAGCGGDYPLYRSGTKFDSGTGWPSFYEPIQNAIVEQVDSGDTIQNSRGFARTEVICARCHAHLGHVFEDGPEPTGKRYCMNSAALIFVPEGEIPKRTFQIGSETEK